MKQTAKRKGNFLLKTALLAVSCYVLVMLIQLHMEIADRHEQLDKLQSSIDTKRRSTKICRRCGITTNLI